MKNLYWAFRIVAKISPLELISIFFINIILSITIPLQLWCYESIIGCLTNSAGYIKYMLILLGLFLIEPIIKQFLIIPQESMSYKVTLLSKKKVIDGVYQRDIHFLDKRDDLLAIDRALYCSETTILQGALGFIEITRTCLSLGMAVGLIYQRSPVLLLLYFLICTFQTIFKTVNAGAVSKLHLLQEPYSKKMHYINQVIKARESVKEVRLFGLAKWLEEKRTQVYTILVSQNNRFAVKWTIINTVWVLAMFIIEAWSIYLAFSSFRIGHINFESFCMLIESQTTFLSLSNVLINALSESRKMSIYINSFRQLTDCRPKSIVRCLDPRIDEAVILKNVKYRYESRNVLSNININIQRGEHIAIVGENGCGKSTLIKLITGLLHNYEGIITVRFKSVSASFQDYTKFNLTIKENMQMTDESCDDSGQCIITILREIGLSDLLEKSSSGIETYLGSGIYPDGIDMSGGQWQLLSIARSIYKDAFLYIYDEASANLDPFAELLQYEYIRKQLNGKTVISVTHRIGIASRADRIIYLAGGEIAESGTHAQLLSHNGAYAELYRKQAGWYEKSGFDGQRN